jgi:serine/threonine-protein kinase
MRYVAIAASLALSAIFSASATAQSLRPYHDRAHGTRALVPSDWREIPSEFDNGIRLVALNGAARLAVWSKPDDGDSLAEYARKIAHDGNVRVTYAPNRRSWFVLSGYRQGAIFYTKVVRGCGRLHHVALEYPREKKRAFDALVTNISRSLRAAC